MQNVLLIQFAREPLPGQVKTRMLPELSPEQACELHRELVLWTSGTLARAGVGTVELAVAGSTSSPLFQHCLGLGVSAISRQSGRDLGERMYRSMASGLERYEKVILVGSDAPQIDSGYLQNAVEALENVDVVLGPAEDGGYVLIGANRLQPDWFEQVAWSSASVYKDTVAQLEATGASWHALSVMRDIDRPEDLPIWQAIVDDAL